jgi:hypothetical protein
MVRDQDAEESHERRQEASAEISRSGEHQIRHQAQSLEFVARRTQRMTPSAREAHLLGLREQAPGKRTPAETPILTMVCQPSATGCAPLVRSG